MGDSNPVASAAGQGSGLTSSQVGPVTILGDQNPGDDILVLRFNAAQVAGQALKVVDHSGNIICSVPPAGGLKVYGDYLSAGPGLSGPFSGVDSGGLAMIFDINAVTLPNPLRVFAGTGAPSGTLTNSNPGDFYLRQDTPGTANQRIYVKTGSTTWTGVV